MPYGEHPLWHPAVTLHRFLPNPYSLHGFHTRSKERAGIGKRLIAQCGGLANPLQFVVGDSYYLIDYNTLVYINPNPTGIGKLPT